MLQNLAFKSATFPLSTGFSSNKLDKECKLQVNELRTSIWVSC